MTQSSNQPTGLIRPTKVRLVRMRVVLPADTVRWLGWLNDPAVTEYLESKGEWTIERLIQWWNASKLHGNRNRFFMMYVGHQAIGTLKLDGLKPRRWATVGLMIGDKSMWGRGLGTAAVSQACRIAKRAGAFGLWCGIRMGNTGSWRVFNNVGFHQVGTIGPGRRDYWQAPGAIPFEVEELMAATKAWPDDGVTRLVMMKRLS